MAEATKQNSTRMPVLRTSGYSGLVMEDGELFAVTSAKLIGNSVLKERADMIVRAVNAHDDLLRACQWFIEQMDSGYIVRDISHDDEAGWALKASKFVSGLRQAQAAIKKAEGKQ